MNGGFDVPQEFAEVLMNMPDIIRGPKYVVTRDGPLGRVERMDLYEKRIAGERIVRFVRGDKCLNTITMDRFLELTGRKSCTT